MASSFSPTGGVRPVARRRIARGVIGSTYSPTGGVKPPGNPRLASGLYNPPPPRSGGGKANRIRKAVRPYEDQQYFTDLAGYDYKRQSALDTANAQEDQTRQAYGFETDATSNPYSRAAVLQRNLQTAQGGSLNSLASRGQLYAGSLNNAREANLESYNQQYDASRREYDNALEKIRAARADAESGYNLDVASAKQSAINRAVKLRPTATTSPRRKKKRR